MVTAEQDRDAGAPGQGQRVDDIARAVVAMVAPDEAAYFEDLSAQFFARPARALQPGQPHDQANGSYLPGVLELVTSIVVAGVSGALSDEIKSLITAATRPGPSLARWRARRKLRAAGPAVLGTRVPPDQEPEAKVAVMKFAVEGELPAEVVTRLGLALAAVLSASSGAGESDGAAESSTAESSTAESSGGAAEGGEDAGSAGTA
jgi:hypothetical protein